jgi:Protein of unknown function with PCYCGC motif
MKRLLVQGAWALLIATLTVAGYAQWSNPADDIPAYNSEPPAKDTKLAPILSGDQLTGASFHYSWQVKVYKEASAIQPVLYQLPCYCRCDRALGHTSLHSCFEGTHGGECSTCAKEEHYAYVMTRRKMTPQQIRAGIERKEFESIDLQAVASVSSKATGRTSGE